jgi:curved DNA-binding protein CbpA
MTDPYMVLGVSPTATPAEITHAYRRRLRNEHPDTRCAESSADADDQLRQILSAYALLRHPQRRATYDLALAADRSDGGPAPTVHAHITFADDPPIQAGPVRWSRRRV